MSRKMIRIVTKSGYQIEAPRSHMLMTYDAGIDGYAPHAVGHIRVGTFLRMALGPRDKAGRRPIDLPLSPEHFDVRAVRYTTPVVLSAHLAEFLGLMVADGTVYKSGFRLAKRHSDVVDRFAWLARDLFGATAKRFAIPNATVAEISSTMLVAWLREIDGLAPHAKAIPRMVLEAPEPIQARFLCGLFEDGTVNIADGRLDHVGWSTKYAEMARLVQILLLQFEIIASRRLYAGNWRISIFGHNAHTFRDAIGFVSAHKNAQLQAPTGYEEGYVIPVGRARLPRTKGLSAVADAAINNGRHRGYISRHGARAIGGFQSDLRFHHERVVRIEQCVGPASWNPLREDLWP